MVAIVAAAIVAYHNSFSGPFVLDDHPVIEGNRTIRVLWPLWVPLSPPQADGSTAAGRPLMNLTLAMNYALGGTNVRGYHAVNLLIHILAGLTLFGVVRRTFLLAARPEYGGDAVLPAFCVALLWSLHPLNTAAVTYLSQRAEALVGLAYLLTLYCFIRAVALDKNSPLLQRSSPSGRCQVRGLDGSSTSAKVEESFDPLTYPLPGERNHFAIPSLQSPVRSRRQPRVPGTPCP
jgi:hypothetical protein